MDYQTVLWPNVNLAYQSRKIAPLDSRVSPKDLGPGKGYAKPSNGKERLAARHDKTFF